MSYYDKNTGKEIGKPKEFNIYKFQVTNKGQLSMNLDPRLVRSLRAYGYGANGTDVGRPGVKQVFDRSFFGGVMTYVEDKLDDPESDIYDAKYYKGQNSPEEVVKIHDRIMELSENTAENEFIERRDIMDWRKKEVDDEIKKSYEDSPNFGMFDDDEED